MKLLAPRTVARRIHRSVTRIVQLDRSGELSAFRDSIGRRFYTEEAVERYISQFGRDRRAPKTQDGASPVAPGSGRRGLEIIARRERATK